MVTQKRDLKPFKGPQFLIHIAANKDAAAVASPQDSCACYSRSMANSVDFCDWLN